MTDTSNSLDIPFEIGTILEDKFRLDRLLGRGAMGVVYLGYDVFLERNVAIKVLNPGSLASEKAVERFRKEAVTMATIKHTNVIQIYSYGERSGHYYFVMEFLEGITLIEFITGFYENGDYIPLDLAIGIILQICSGLSAVHKHGIAHRDIKPANILISKKNYHLAITDFGLTYLNPSPDDKFVEGTPLYLAPERIKSKNSDTQLLHLADIYAVGCIFYELLSGKPPFENDNIISLLNDHINKEIPKVTDLRPDIPLYIDDIIKLAMAKEMQDRFQSCNQLKDHLLNLRVPTKRKSIIRPYILILDSYQTGEQVSIFLKNNGCSSSTLNIDVIDDHEETIAIATNDKPDLIIIVENEEDYSILELCSILRHSKIPIFLYLKMSDNPMTLLFQEMGVQKIFTPPIDMYNLCEEVSLFLRHND